MKSQSTRQVELKYIRLQTFIAGTSLISTLAMSAIGLWIGVQINENSEIQRRHEREEQSKADTARKKDELDFNCLNMIVQLSNTSEKLGKNSDEVANIAESIEGKCQKSSVISSLTFIYKNKHSMVRDTDSFIKWAYSNGYYKLEDVENGYKVYKSACAACNEPIKTSDEIANDFENWVSSHEK
ncbi:hypothetical protein [Caulobacter sp. CCG-8]|uniref:hypothetical protein n=1 Tax=Caulobacter sp. CCG-8 TaxID=3127958 RepID=UPI00307E3B46